jgi:replicative DNA helicase
MRTLYEKAHPIDLVTLKNELDRVGDLSECGGPVYVAVLGDGVPRATNIRYYADIVREKASKRDVIRLANELLNTAYEDEDQPGAIVDMAERGLLEISEQSDPGDLVGAPELVQQVMPRLAELHEMKRPISGISTGFTKLDRFTRGLQPGTLNILAARTSQGKSTLAGQLLLNVAGHVPVAFFSLEMSREELMFRLIATQARIDGHDLQCGRLDMFGQRDVGLAVAELAGKKFWIDDSGEVSALQVRSRSRRLKAKHHGLGLIVIDYLQLMQHPKGETNEQRVAATSRSLRILAKELKVPVLALCQLSRAADQRQDPRPRLSDLRESGALEQDAHVVLLIYRPAPKENEPAKPTELILAKQRNGPTTTVYLRWLGEQYRFEEVES